MRHSAVWDLQTVFPGREGRMLGNKMLFTRQVGGGFMMNLSCILGEGEIIF